MNRIIDRSQALNAISDDSPGKAQLKADIPRLKRRAALLNKSILFAIISAIITSILVIVAFVTAYLNVPHEYGVGLFLSSPLAFFTASLVNLARETRIALHDYDHASSAIRNARSSIAKTSDLPSTPQIKARRSRLFPTSTFGSSKISSRNAVPTRRRGVHS
jgi:hypothetical protein